MPESSRNCRANATPSSLTGGTKLFIQLCNFLFRMLSVVVRSIFRVIYGTKGESMQPICNPILLESATSLARRIRERQLSCEQVMQAFIDRVKANNPILNFVADQRFAEALKEAKDYDRMLESGEFNREDLARTKPFLGVPMSTKDCISVRGMLYTAGLYPRKDIRADEDAAAIARMRAAGAIPFCLTNVSEACMWWESNNPVHGRTRNPYDSNRIVGGSSGGEGCIQATAASGCGIGSDIGGSIRMPAFFNGVFGHKPSKFVVPNKGQFPMPFNEEQNSFLGIGPIVRHAEDLKPMLRVIAGEKAACLRLDEPVDLKQLKVYYQENDGGGLLISPVDEDLRLALLSAVQHLQKLQSKQAQRIQLAQFRQSTDIWFVNMKDDSGYLFEHQLANLQGSINPYTELLKWFVGLSKHTLVGLITAMVDKMQCCVGSPKHQHFVRKRNELRDEMQELLGENGVLIYPTHPTVAPYHNEPFFRPLNFSYTGIINVLGFPATAVPLGLGREGVPLGVQVVANVNQDRLCLAVAEELERAFGGWVQPQSC